MRLVPLTQGLFSLVDDEDYARVMQYRWCASKQSEHCYAVRTVKVNGRRTTQPLARFILGAGPGVVVDHVNHDTLDNRRSNLRVCTRKENCANVSKKRHCTSHYRVSPVMPSIRSGEHASQSRAR